VIGGVDGFLLGYCLITLDRKDTLQWHWDKYCHMIKQDAGKDFGKGSRSGSDSEVDSLYDRNLPFPPPIAMEKLGNYEITEAEGMGVALRTEQ